MTFLRDAFDLPPVMFNFPEVSGLIAWVTSGRPKDCNCVEGTTVYSKRFLFELIFKESAIPIRREQFQTNVDCFDACEIEF